MFTCGLYDYAGEWAYRVGLPAKSGVGGGLLAVVPGRFGIGVFSPLLDERGNSVRAIKVCEGIVQSFGAHIFDLAFTLPSSAAAHEVHLEHPARTADARNGHTASHPPEPHRVA
jgi:glutaminase